MKNFSLTILLILFLASILDAQAGWFGSSSSSDPAVQKKLADAEKKLSIRNAEAKAAAKKYKADLSKKSADARKKAKKQVKVAKAESEGIVAKKVQQLKNIFY